jgi:hypothetical protein
VESPKLRRDLPDPRPVDSGDAKRAGSAADLPPDQDVAPARTKPEGK